MIKLVENTDINTDNFIYGFGSENIYVAVYRRHKALYAQESDGVLTAAMLPSASSSYILASPEADFSELAAFNESFAPKETITNIADFPGERLAAIPVYAADSIIDEGRRNPAYSVKRATEEKTFKEVYELLTASDFDLPEFEVYFRSSLSLSNRGGGVYVIEDDGKSVSTASIMGQDSRQGLIGGVATSPLMRGRGLGGHIVGDVAEVILNRGLTAVICCVSEKAGRVYERIGFRRVSELYKFR